jgi:NAD(P)H-dependent FMN reductase
MPRKILVFYGSYRTDRTGIRLASYLISRLVARGDAPELVDAREIGLPMMDRRYREFPEGQAPEAMQKLAEKIKAADAFIFVAGEYNHGVQPGLKNLTDHFLEEWFWRPVAIASYSINRISGTRAGEMWKLIASEMGLVVSTTTLAVGPIAETLDEAGNVLGSTGAALERAFPQFADELCWWSDAAAAHRAIKKPPY